MTATTDHDRDDAQLLAIFVSGAGAERDAAFAELVARHAAMVAATCRRWLRGADVEDATQAVFLVLAQRAASIRVGAALPGWLHQTAWNIAQRAAAAARTRRTHEREAAQEAAMQQHGAVPAQPVDLDGMLVRLPPDYRIPLILHYLEGLPQAEVARRLGLKENAIAMRLSRGREMLRARLARCGAPATALGLFLVAAAPLSAAEESGIAAVAVQAREGTVSATVQSIAHTLPVQGLSAVALVSVSLLAVAIGAVGVAVGTRESASSSAGSYAPAQVLPGTWSREFSHDLSGVTYGTDGSILLMSGDRLFRFAPDGRVRNSWPLSGQGCIMMASSVPENAVLFRGHDVRSKFLAAVNAETGAELWRRTVSRNSSFHIHPGIGDSRGYFYLAEVDLSGLSTRISEPDLNGMIEIIPKGSVSTRLVKIDETGRELWNNSSTDDVTCLSDGFRGNLLAGTGDGRTMLFSPIGDVRWVSQVRGSIRCMASSDRFAYVGSGENYLGFNSNSGRISDGDGRVRLDQVTALDRQGVMMWQVDVDGLVTHLVSTSDGNVVYFTQSRGVASSEWQKPRSSDAAPVVGARCGMIGSGGQRVWETSLRAPVSLGAQRFDAHGRIVLAGFDGWLTLLSKEGEILSEREIGGRLEGLQIGPDGRLAIVSNGYGRGAPVAPIATRLVVLMPEWPEPKNRNRTHERDAQ